MPGLPRSRNTSRAAARNRRLARLRQETEYDAGLIFVAFQGDPRKGFIPINDRLAKFDMMNQFTTHVGSGVFACPPGARPGSYIGAGLFET